MIKRQFGCGGNKLAGWENYDCEIDATKALPFPDNSTDYVFAEHLTEHLDCKEVYGFFSECYRILKKGGTIRICVPSISRVYLYADEEYLKWLGSSGFGEAALKSAIRNLMVNHGHKTVWSEELLGAALRGVGFGTVYASVGISEDPNLHDIEGHWKAIGKHPNWVESIVMEGIK
jgi:predicted SAM-dependent methyltransferase